MKTHLLLWSLIAVAPFAAGAQTQKATPAQLSTATAAQSRIVVVQVPPVVVEPGAQALLYKAMARYKQVRTLRFRVSVREYGKKIVGYRFWFGRPNLLRVEAEGAARPSVVSDGHHVFEVHNATYSRHSITPSSLATTFASNGLASLAIGSMLNGQSFADSFADRLREIYGDDDSDSNLQSVKIHALLGPRHLMKSGMWRSVRFNVSCNWAEDRQKPVWEKAEILLWFDQKSLLRQTQGRTVVNSRRTVGDERILNQQINPAFAPDTFGFDARGLKKDYDEDALTKSRFDARLKVGAKPFAFSAQSLDGELITPADYKGKVLLLDFWATWCGPCVGAIPELQGVYNKYHAQGLEVVGISLDEDKSALTSFIKARKMAWSQVFDGKGWKSTVPNLYGVKAIPFMLIIGKDGKIAAVNPRGNIDAAVKAALAAS
jgi:peroxiredoxin